VNYNWSSDFSSDVRIWGNLDVHGTITSQNVNQRTECDDMEQGTAEVIRDLAIENGEFQQLEPGVIHAVMSAKDGKIQALDLTGDEYLPVPRRKKGTVTVRDAESFLAYYGKHKANGQSEIYADPERLTVTGVLNAYPAEGTDWRDHKITLALQKSPQWTAWLGFDRVKLPQVEFCEFLDEHIHDVTKSAGGASAAELMEFATNFSSHRTLTFQSSARLRDGTTQFQYIEAVDDHGGQKAREAAMPPGFMLAIAPFTGAEPVQIHATLRHRIENRSLKLEYRLDDPAGVQREAMLAVMAHIAEQTGDTVMTGTPAL